MLSPLMLLLPRALSTPATFISMSGKVKNPDFLKEVSSVCNKEDHLVVGCQSGVRSLYATTDLVADGYKDVKDMGGGYMEWVKNKFPVKSSLGKEDL
ncbi:hypothetical protein Ahy_Scaffold1g107116 [Arachis hypogaea]|uniref:Rhodanese domain-containing protein n=1 Tax=Arachis hypogaea TaxID=3818 RepID=A0A444WUR1_ARAHY|nr:hypothetical protein Ahy_Scaffold1g107116 [Arachis hypogaea]